jgi:signal transduction histidine kinase
MELVNKNTGNLALERVNRELSALYELCATIIQSIDVAEFLQTLVERAGQILQVGSGSIVMPDPDGFLRIKAYFGFKEEHARNYALRPDEGRGGRIFATQQPQIFVTSQDVGASWFHPITHQEKIEHTIGAPMIDNRGHVMGVLFLNDKISREPFDERDLKILENFANLAAIAVEKQIQLEELSRQKERYRELSERLESSLNELNAVNERLRESNKLKDEVLSICAHDVRSPLTSIVSYSELLLSSDNINEKQKRYIGHIHRSSEKINNLVQNLLIRARYLESNEPLRLESVSLGRLAREAVQQIEDRLASKQLTVKIDDRWQQRIRADRFKLAQVIDNLIDNASKFSPESSEIVIEIFASDNVGNSIEVLISNPGEGIPSEAIPRLFLRYFQVSPGQQRTGYGLGLAICKQNIEAHGGSISVESVLNERTSFRFTLPIGNPYILVISADDKFVEQIFEALPEEEHWRKEVLSDGKACLDKIIVEMPTALVIDETIKDFNIGQLIAQLRREFDPARLIVALIGNCNDNSEIAEQAKLLPSSFSAEQLLDALKF